MRSLGVEPSNGSFRRMPSLECSLKYSSDLLDWHGGKYANLLRAKGMEHLEPADSTPC